MAYKAYPIDQINDLGAQYKKTKVELEKLTKEKGDKKQIATLQKSLENQGKLIQKKLETDIAGVVVNFKEHALKADKYVAMAADSLKIAKKGLEGFSDDPNRTMHRKRFLDATDPAGVIKLYHTMMADDADDYGKSWFGYRGYNGTGPSHSLDKSIVAKFNSIVGKLMNDQKGVATKISKIDGLAKEAEVIKNQAESLAKEFEGATDALETEAQKLLKEVDTLLLSVVKHPKMNITSLEGKQKSIAQGLKQKKETYGADYERNITSLYKDCVATHKLHVDTFRAIEKLCNTAVPRLAKSSSAEVKKCLKQTAERLKGAQKLQEQATKIMKDVVPNTAKVIKKCQAAEKTKKKK